MAVFLRENRPAQSAAAGKNDRSKRRPASCSTPHAFNECERVDGLGVGLDTLDMGPRTIRSVSNCISAVPGEGAAAERHGAR